LMHNLHELDGDLDVWSKKHRDARLNVF
jgi:hypothetical protein